MGNSASLASLSVVHPEARLVRARARRAIGRFIDVVALVLEDQDERGTNIGIVFHHQHWPVRATHLSSHVPLVGHVRCAFPAHVAPCRPRQTAFHVAWSVPRAANH
jgi:hypothetical protein